MLISDRPDLLCFTLKLECLYYWIHFSDAKLSPEMYEAGVSLTLSAGGQLAFAGRQNMQTARCLEC